MPYNPDLHHRRSIRLQGYDYSQAGAYFVTICINQRQSLLGEIENGIMKPIPAGEMVQTITTAKYRHGVNQQNWQAFEGRLWQRNYHEHIIHRYESCNYLRQYIAHNPLSWESDSLNSHSILDSQS